MKKIFSKIFLKNALDQGKNTLKIKEQHLELLANYINRIDPAILEFHLIKMSLFNLGGAFVPVKGISPVHLSIIAQNYAYSEWSRIAIDVANQYGDGDYFEFGSEGLNTLCNFIVAFHMNGHDVRKPNVKCFAFDIFGDPDGSLTLTSEERKYFAAYSKGKHFFSEMQEKLNSFDLMKGRVELIKGFFKNTLNDNLKARLNKENRKVGFAFLDCNIDSSYKTVLEFLEDFLHPKSSFIYLDEYYQFGKVADLYDEFTFKIKKKHGLKSRFVKTAGSFGALFRISS